MLIDDFRTGPHSRTLRAGEDRNTQSGPGILGNLRNTWISFITNPFDTPVTIDVGREGLIVATGPETSHRLELAYGLGDAWMPGTSLNLNLANLRALRLRFAFDDLSLGCVLYLTSGIVAGHPSSSIWAGQVKTSGDVEIPLDGSTWSVWGANLASIDFIWMIFYPALFGGNDYVISSFEAVA